MTTMTPVRPGFPGSTGGSGGNGHKRWRNRPITNLRGTIGALIVAGGFLLSAGLIRAEARERDRADCQSLNDRTRFGAMSRENEIERIGERVDGLEARVSAPFDPTDFPGYDALDEATQVFVNGLTARNRETALTELAAEQDNLAAAKDDLTLYLDTIPFIDCNRNDDIDDGDFTGR
jgi:deoxycytidylate deaminase